MKRIKCLFILNWTIAVLFLGTGQTAFGANCASLLVNSFENLITKILTSNELSASALTQILTSEKPFNPMPKRGLKAHQLHIAKAIDGLIKGMGQPEWNQVKDFARRRLNEIHQHDQNRAHAKVETAAVLKPKRIGHLKNDRPVSQMQFEGQDLHLIHYGQRGGKSRSMGAPADGIQIYSSISVYKNDPLNILPKILAAAPKRLADGPSAEVNLKTFSLNGEIVAIRTFDTGPSQMRPDKPYIGQYIGESLEFMRDLPPLTSRIVQVYRIKGKNVHLEKEYAMGGPLISAPFHCQQYGEELDCVAMTARETLFFQRAANGVMTNETSLSFPQVAGLTNKHYSIRTTRLPDGRPIVAISNSYSVNVYLPTDSASPLRVYEHGDVRDTTWIALENQVLLVAIGESQSYIAEPLISGNRVPFDVQAGDEADFRRTAWTQTNDGRVILAVCDVDLDIQFFDLFSATQD